MFSEKSKGNWRQNGGCEDYVLMHGAVAERDNCRGQQPDNKMARNSFFDVSYLWEHFSVQSPLFSLSRVLTLILHRKVTFSQLFRASYLTFIPFSDYTIPLIYIFTILQSSFLARFTETHRTKGYKYYSIILSETTKYKNVWILGGTSPIIIIALFLTTTKYSAHEVSKAATALDPANPMAYCELTELKCCWQ